MFHERGDLEGFLRNHNPVASQAQRSQTILEYRRGRRFVAQTADMLSSEVPGLKGPQRKVRLREFRTW
jgi:hypothetical protein